MINIRKCSIIKITRNNNWRIKFIFVLKNFINLILLFYKTRLVKQQNQVDKILQHKNKFDSPVIISGDFNNTAFSYVYHQLSKDMNDAFLLAGSDIGTTFIFENYPMRIDYLLATKDLKVLDFNTIKKTFSDHYPISATFGWN